MTELNIQRDKSRLYYEAHVTLSQGAFMRRNTERETALNRVCEKHDMRPSTFLLVKPEDPEPQAFVSARDESFERICKRVWMAIVDLEAEGFSVKRWKIEDTVLDSNRGDDLARLVLYAADD